MNVDLYLTPIKFTSDDLHGRTVVAIDVLRCSTSICAAFQAGARGVIPTDEPGKATEAWSKLGADAAVLAGERGGIKIESFQLGNSPTEFNTEVVSGKLVVMTTTNGTRLYNLANNAGPVITCALVNISKVAARVAADSNDLVIVCSGQDGRFSIEDTICGGMLIDLLETAHQKKLCINDAASVARLLFQSNKDRIRQAVSEGEHGRYLASLDCQKDIEIATSIDSIPVLPILRDGQHILEDGGVLENRCDTFAKQDV